MENNMTGSNPNNQEAADLSKENTPESSNDLRDEKIKNEPDTARLRSERQSVIDGEKERSGD